MDLESEDNKPPGSPEAARPGVKALGGRVASGTVWLGGVTAVTRVIGIFSQFALMWLLAPEHFGTLGLVFTITMFATHLTYPGTDDVLLQKGDQVGRWASAGFWMSLACGLAGGLAMVLLGLTVVTIARSAGNPAYGSPVVLHMIIIYAIGAPLNAMALVPYVMLRTQMRFGRLAAVQMMEMLGQHTLMVLLAWWGFGAYSFAIPMPIIALLRTGVLWLYVRPKISWRLGLHRWPHLATATGYVLGFRLLQTGWHHGDQIVLGTVYASKTINGHYQSAVQLTQQIVRVLCENLLSVLVPALTQIRDDRPRIERAVATACRTLSAMIIPLATLQILLVGPVIRMAFPARWIESIVLVELLSFGPILFAGSYPMMAMITSDGRFKAAFGMAIANLCTFFALVIPLTVVYGARGTAAGVSAFYWIAAHFYAYTAFASFRGVRVLHLAVYRALLAAAVGAVPALALLGQMSGTSRWAEAGKIAAVTPVMLGTYVAVMWIIDPRTVRSLYGRLMGAMGPIVRRIPVVGSRL
ncbi:MAG TPA: oligosaccharide flippase family protein [Tepidisphaeraceae bacterium]|nr:oligosaccharide flippase family protein [Tepidisphaeraceae bacterium]